VNTLMRGLTDEHVIATRSSKSPQKHPMTGIEVLPLIHEKMIHWICRSPFSLRRRRQIDSFRTGFDDQRRQVIDFHITQRVVRRSPDTVRFDNIPDERTLLPRQPNATRWALHPQILTLLRQPVGQNDLFVLVLKEHTIMRPLRQILGSRLERAVPVRIVTPVLDPQVGSAQERCSSL